MNPVKTNIISDVGDFVHPQSCSGLDSQRLGFPWFVFRGMVDGFVQLSGQDLHNAVSIGMVVNGRTLSRVPHEKKLRMSVGSLGEAIMYNSLCWLSD